MNDNVKWRQRRDNRGAIDLALPLILASIAFGPASLVGIGVVIGWLIWR